MVRTSGTAEPASVIGMPDGAVVSTGDTTEPGAHPGEPEPRAEATAGPGIAPKTPSEPSWGRVVATTVILWLSRRPRRAAWRPRRPSARSLRLAILALALAVAASAIVRFTGSPAPAARSSSSGSPRQAQASHSPAGPAAALGAAATVRSQAAAWVAGEVSGDGTVACDPRMCAALTAHGVAASRLLPLPSATRPYHADLIVASQSASSQFAGQLGDGYTPTLMASFGSGPSLIEVRTVSPGGTAAYDSALRADLASRRSAGTQLLHSRRIEASGGSGQQLQAGEVDTRLLVTLAVLASLEPLRVIAFGDGSPGVRAPSAAVPLRQVTLARADGLGGAAGLATALAMVRAQHAPYQAAHVTIVDLAAGQAGLLIVFAAPAPLGLLTGRPPG